ncbi:hypothetical protein OUZ56_027923 [Daphnia magna]|uniref:Uncharacterized protein n=1 Tax=Daphnia magna TaxID=35525 RepID=A0ABR0B2B5_9CRUS|nr:hypothetical protein OUZ56_027923 [Daphnia magna]
MIISKDLFIFGEQDYLKLLRDSRKRDMGRPVTSSKCEISRETKQRRVVCSCRNKIPIKCGVHSCTLNYNGKKANDLPFLFTLIRKCLVVRESSLVSLRSSRIGLVLFFECVVIRVLRTGATSTRITFNNILCRRNRKANGKVILHKHRLGRIRPSDRQGNVTVKKGHVLCVQWSNSPGNVTSPCPCDISCREMANEDNLLAGIKSKTKPKSNR